MHSSLVLALPKYDENGKGVSWCQERRWATTKYQVICVVLFRFQVSVILVGYVPCRITASETQVYPRWMHPLPSRRDGKW